jgi:hypothetical protein
MRYKPCGYPKGYFVLLCIFVLACSSARPAQPVQPTQPAAPTAPAMHTVTYQIGGTGRNRVDLTYENASGNSQQETINVPWSIEFQAPAGQFVYLSGQLAVRGASTVTCKILVDGEVLEEATSQGEYVIASCSGSVPQG